MTNPNQDSHGDSPPLFEDLYPHVTEANTIVDSYVNGQRKQMTEQFRNSENKPEVLDYIRSLHGTDMVAAIAITFFTFDQNGWA